jgi:hypothetical protein
MRWAPGAVIALSACYSPNAVGGSPCDLTTRLCPTGQTCVASGGGSAGTCTLDHGGLPDAGGGMPDAGPCLSGAMLGSHLVGSVCLSTAPAGPVTLTAVGGPINSGTVASGGCTELIPRTGGPALCVIAGTTIDIPAAVTVRAFAVNPGAAGIATNPLVLIATDSITIEGTIDVASHFNDTLAGGIQALGAGARTAVGCAVTGLDGAMGKPVTGSPGRAYGGGGGAGGSLGTLGGAGGNGGNNSNTAPGAPVAGTGINQLVGGCPGGTGGMGGGAGGGAGPGGNGGGAVYLLAGTSITIAGKINASGSGGSAGGPGDLSSGGGGGGGSGGMIGFEAPKVTIATGAAVFANGGGGAAGCGQDPPDTGSSGTDPTGPTPAAGAGTGKNGGGGGGAGSVAAGTGVAGTKGGGNSTGPESAGGGGGGGAGVVRVFSTQPATIQGAVSPPVTQGN